MSDHIRPRSRFLPLAAGLLFVLGGALAANAVHVRRLERELKAFADGKLAEFRADAAPGRPKPSRIGSKVVAAKQFVLWGEPFGKVSVYIEYTGEGQGVHVEGYDFFFARNADSTWTETESGRCSSAECSMAGKEVLDAVGERF